MDRVGQSDRSDHLRQARRLIAVVRDFERGLPELRKRNPELAEKILREQRDVASKAHRTPPPSLDGMRF